MYKLFQGLRADQQQTRGEALKAYSEILSRADEPKRGDAEKLRALLETLGITVADAELDAGALAEVKAATAQLADPATLAKWQEERDATEAAHAKAKLDWEAREKVLELAKWEAAGRVNSQYLKDRDAQQTIDRLRQSRPHAFGIDPPTPKPATAADSSYEWRYAPGSEPKREGPVPKNVLEEAERLGKQAVDYGGKWGFVDKPATATNE